MVLNDSFFYGDNHALKEYGGVAAENNYNIFDVINIFF